MLVLRTGLFLALVVACTLPVVAGPTVLFTDGRTLRVEEVERRDAWILLTLEGGGVLSVPRERVANWEELAAHPKGRRPTLTVGRATSGAWRRAAGEHAELIGSVAERYNLDPVVLTALAQVESAFDDRAVSPKGASGLLQLMPTTADRFGVRDVFDAADNVEGGARYLSWLLDRYDGRMELALAGYNAGEGAVDRYRGIPPFRETQQYVRKVLEGAARLVDLAP